MAIAKSLLVPPKHPPQPCQPATGCSEMPCLPVCELCRTASIRITSTAAFTSCSCFATTSHIPVGEACHLAGFGYSLTAKTIPDFRFTQGQGGGGLGSNPLSQDCRPGLRLTRLPASSVAMVRCCICNRSLRYSTRRGSPQ
jgi:hypothetical protein